MDEAWNKWLSSADTHNHQALPIITIWGIGIAQNKAIFQILLSIPKITTINSLDILSYFPQQKDSPTIRNITVEQINKSKPWDFFYGAAQNKHCDGGPTLHFSDTHYFHIQMGLGTRTINSAELSA